jgi:acyl-CoA dehydrogenase
MLSGRFADGLIYMYMASAVLKRYEDTGCPEEDKPLMEWSVRHCLFNVQIALDQILRNFPNTPIGLLLRGIVFPLGRRYRTPNDKLTRQCAEILMTPGDARDRLTEGAHINDRPDDVTGCLEHAFNAVIAASDAQRKLKKSRRSRPYDQSYSAWLGTLVSEGVITDQEKALLEVAEEATNAVIRVDDFPNEFRHAG